MTRERLEKFEERVSALEDIESGSYKGEPPDWYPDNNRTLPLFAEYYEDCADSMAENSIISLKDLENMDELDESGKGLILDMYRRLGAIELRYNGANTTYFVDVWRENEVIQEMGTRKMDEVVSIINDTELPAIWKKKYETDA
ncbi:MAG: hypothetical protein ABEJ03_00390 [Candidatus Nanohaloarchaea archaeon]